MNKRSDTIEVPRALISVVSSDIPEFISVHALSRIDYGVRVLVEPATVEDWELIEIYSNLMEEGGLLSQVSVIYPDQHLTLCVDGMDRVNIRINQVTTRNSSNPGDDENPIWPEISLNSSDFSIGSGTKNSSPQCVLLVQDTEMIVEPKTRPRKKMISWLDPLRVIPSDLDWGLSFDKLSTLTGRGPFSVDPGCVLLKTEQWPFETEWAQIRSQDSKQIRIVRIMTSSRIPRNSAGTPITSYFQSKFRFDFTSNTNLRYLR